MPKRKGALAGVRVLITRPESQAGILAARVREAGGLPVCLPTLAIFPVHPGPEEIDALAGSEMVIFISPNAATHGYPLLRDAGAAPRQIVAVGRSTRAVLERLGSGVVHDPGERGSSETLLAQAFLQDVAGRRICIVRGQGGRELLRDTLTTRGARVSYLECYRRARPPRPDPATLERALDAGTDTMVITATSTTGLAGLLAMVPVPHRDRLVELPLVVIGDRQEAAARRHGWRGPVITANPGDDQIVEGVIAWRCDRRPEARD